MGKIKKGVKKFQKKLAGGGVHKKKKLHFRRDKAEAAKAAEERATVPDPKAKSTGTVFDPKMLHTLHRESRVRTYAAHSA